MKGMKGRLYGVSSFRVEKCEGQSRSSGRRDEEGSTWAWVLLRKIMLAQGSRLQIVGEQDGTR